jgi:HEAT repeat protein
VAPALTKALHDPIPQVRLLAAAALLRVDADAARKAGAMRVVISILKDPDPQVACRAAGSLGGFQAQPELAVPALIECLRHTNTLVASQAVWSLEQFGSNADLIHYSDVLSDSHFSSSFIRRFRRDR